MARAQPEPMLLELAAEQEGAHEQQDLQDSETVPAEGQGQAGARRAPLGVNALGVDARVAPGGASADGGLPHRDDGRAIVHARSGARISAPLPRERIPDERIPGERIVDAKSAIPCDGLP